MTDMAFRGRVKVAVLRFASYIADEGPSAPAEPEPPRPSLRDKVMNAPSFTAEPLRADAPPEQSSLLDQMNRGELKDEKPE